MKIKEMTFKELGEFIADYKKRIADEKIGKYHCENDNFDPETMHYRYKLLKEEYDKRLNKAIMS